MLVSREINSTWLSPEHTCLAPLLLLAKMSPARQRSVQTHALQLVEAVRTNQATLPGMESFLQEYHLGSREGVILMCLAEALLRIPDADTVDRLIADRISDGDWADHLGDSDSVLVNASTWGLMLTGQLIDIESVSNMPGWLARLASKLGEPVVRSAMRQAMRIMASQYVMGRNIDAALERAVTAEARIWRYSFDMLGEAALTQDDADRYFAKYLAAIESVGRQARATDSLFERAGISVKLSALHPRFEISQRQRVLSELGPRLLQLVTAARTLQISLTVDAEEADRLELTLLLVDEVLRSDVLKDYAGFGLAVQAYQRRAPEVIRWLTKRASELQRRIAIRLVKGAYWDTEIKRAQERGLDSFPVYTRKASTDVSYLACAQLLAQARAVIHAQFATHNAHTVAYICELYCNDSGAFEFQRLHGMGEALYEALRQTQASPVACRVYAPVGAHRDLLPYLVRRLLENGANTSFVNRIVDARLPAASVVSDPVALIAALQVLENPQITPPPLLFGPSRHNSHGPNLADSITLTALQRDCALAAKAIGATRDASLDDVERALAKAVAAFPDWEALGADQRAACLLRAADAFEAHLPQFLARCTEEAGKTLVDGVAEVREAVDFLRYYAVQASSIFRETLLPGPTGERNILRLRGRGVFACISPWNFPLAIFTGQVAAALVTGNTVLAKPAEQTPRTAALAVALLHAAGIPGNVLQFLPGDGATGAALTRDVRIAGVVFTGSTATARLIERSLAARNAPIATLIAETGGINAMLVDSSALPEQVVQDVISSGFNSAGQRCSALRVLLLQEDIAPRVLTLLAGAMDQLKIGDPAYSDTDVGPVIDGDALAILQRHAARVVPGAPWHHQVALPAGLTNGHYFAPLAVEMRSFASVDQEIFGPIVHVVRFHAGHLPALIEQINSSGYGLTLGIHSRIEARARDIAARVRVGNVYINRNMIGAVVGVQPFGGMGLSGTGPKAGGPGYLQRFTTEQTITTNTAAVGGNASLLTDSQEQS
jgi:RHH-type transcriptional regulator, proline utilization regulon repressor / proline dehydrogenase / delta 1-pyrroline-5-carboxylate dehydrogenase